MVARLNGNTPLILILSAFGVFATFVALHERRIADTETMVNLCATRIAVVETDMRYIRASLDEIKVMLKERGK